MVYAPCSCLFKEDCRLFDGVMNILFSNKQLQGKYFTAC